MKKFFIFLTIFACLGTFKVQAQDTENSNIEEIIVTSLKRANGIAAQDLPVSVTAISEQLIIDSESIDLSDIGRMVPNATHFILRLRLPAHQIS